jgi:hypothetical protein
VHSTPDRAATPSTVPPPVELDDLDSPQERDDSRATALPPRERAASGRLGDADPPQWVGDIVELDGPQGEQLARRQAAVLWEVTRWVAQNRSKPGRPQAA